MVKRKGRITTFFLALFLLDVFMLLGTGDIRDAYIFLKWKIIAKNAFVVVVWVLMELKPKLIRPWIRISIIAVLFLAFGIFNYVDGLMGEAHEPLIWETIGPFFAVLFPITNWGMDWGMALTKDMNLSFLTGIALGTVYYFLMGLLFEKFVSAQKRVKNNL